MTTVIRNIGRLFTSGPEGVLEDAWLLMADGEILSTGIGQQPGADQEIDAGGALVTPGLIDAHTHPVYAGDRFDEIALRSAGATYAEIAESGGGIGATLRATRSAARDDLETAVRGRLAKWLEQGTTSVEVKTGYQLTKEGELADVAMLAALSGSAGLPDLSVTFLAAHAVPPEMSGRADDYLAQVAAWSSEAQNCGATSIDVFCDLGYFTVDQARRVLRAGSANGLVPRIHADELAHTGGGLLAAELGVRSADHLLRCDDIDAVALASAGVVATLCPVTALAMGEMPPVRTFVDHGVTIALGTDHNPGMSGTSSMSLIVGLGVHAFGVSVDEALRAATAGGAASLGFEDRGQIAPGKRADLVVWSADHEGAFAWELGLLPSRVFLEGVEV
jgi:imidazolonepropionase